LGHYTSAARVDMLSLRVDTNVGVVYGSGGSGMHFLSGGDKATAPVHDGFIDIAALHIACTKPTAPASNRRAWSNLQLDASSPISVVLERLSRLTQRSSNVELVWRL
jgi:hypothetical protein